MGMRIVFFFRALFCKFFPFEKRSKGGIKRGFSIGIEGGDGAGKDTLIEKLKEKYKNWDVVFTREPGGTPYGEEYRVILLVSDNAKQSDDLTRLLGFFAARRDTMKNLVIPNLLKGWNVVSGRNAMSSFIYNATTEELRKLFWILYEAVLGEYKPDLYILLDISPETSLKRKGNVGVEINHYDNAEFKELVRRREASHEFLKYVPHKVIDAEQSKECVFEEAVKILDHYLVK